MDIRDNIKLEVVESQPYTGDLNARALDMWITLNGFKMIDPTVTIQVKGYNNGFKDTVVTADDNGKYRYIIPPELQSAGSLKLEVYAKQNDLIKVMGVYYKQVIPNEMGVLVPAEHLPTYEDFYRMYNDVKTGITVNSSNVKITPAGNIQSLNIQDAINELDTEKVPITTKVNGKPLSGDITLKAADIENTPSGTISATNVQNAINELEAEKVNKTDNDLSLSTKADKVFATNLLDDGDFSSGTISGWNGSNATVEFFNGGLKAVGNGKDAYISAYKPLSVALIEGHKYYVRFKATVDNGATFIQINVGVSYVTLKTNPTGTSIISRVITCQKKYNYLSLYELFSDSYTQNGKTFLLDDIEVIDLTATYGAGNEPTKEFMDTTPYILTTGELYSLRNLPEFLDDKVNKVQEAWITPTLLNGWSDHSSAVNSAQFFKDNFGTLHIRGIIKGATINTTAFVLPVGYRPAKTTQVPVVSNNAFGFLSVSPAGNVTPVIGNVSWFSLDGIQIDL